MPDIKDSPQLAPLERLSPTEVSIGGRPIDASGPKDPRSEQPRIVEEHHILGPNGEDEIEATDDRGRRWYDVRPEPRRRADVGGINYTYWLFCIAILIILFLPW